VTRLNPGDPLPGIPAWGPPLTGHDNSEEVRKSNFCAPTAINGAPYAWSFPNRDSAIYWSGQLRVALPGHEFWLFDMRALPMEFL